MTNVPRKESLYRTAQLRRDLFGFSAGDFVSVLWVEEKHGRNIYACYRDGQLLGEADDVLDLTRFTL